MARDPFLQSLPMGVDVPPALHLMHSGPGHYAGRCSVVAGRGWLTKLALRLGRFPKDANDIPVQVWITRSGGVWHWLRDFDGHTTQSQLTFDHGAECVREQLGWLTLWLVPEIREGRFFIHIERLSIFGLRCPSFLLPRSSTVEWQGETEEFCFDVSAEMPGLGSLIRYRGWLTPVHARASSD